MADEFIKYRFISFFDRMIVSIGVINQYQYKLKRKKENLMGILGVVLIIIACIFVIYRMATDKNTTTTQFILCIGIFVFAFMILFFIPENLKNLFGILFSIYMTIALIIMCVIEWKKWKAKKENRKKYPHHHKKKRR